MSNPGASGPHILVFPLPAQGHMIPLLDLAHQLAVRGFTITVLVTPKVLPLLDSFLSQSPTTVQTLVLPFPDHPSLPTGVEHVRDIPSTSSVSALIHALGSLHPHILQWARSRPSPPHAIISDFFLGWTHHLAHDLSVPRLVFFSSGPLLASVLHHIWRLLPGPTDSTGPVLLPGLPSFSYPHLPSVYRRYTAGNSDWEFTRDGFIANSLSWGAVFNTFDALEGTYLAYLRELYGHHRVWAVGPILPVGPTEHRGGRSSVDLAAWLATCPARSVVYVCFGSQYTPSKAQAQALATALERSGARFVWGTGGAAVPEGFEERVEGRGVVARGWVPQVAVLEHGAVGSFVTHCGWNSVLEGLSAGVTLLAWPMLADQFVNARLLVEEAGVAVRVCEGADAVPDSDELARVLAESVGEGSWPETRARAVEMGRKAAEAVREGGSSFKDLERMVEELKKLS